MNTTEYLIHRKIKDTDYCKFVSSENTVIEYKPIVLGVGLEFQVSVIFSDNGKYPLSIEQANKNLGFQTGNEIAIGLLEGDDIICMDISSGAIYFWLIENGDGEKIRIASSFKEFIELISVD